MMINLRDEIRECLWPQVQSDGSIKFIIPDYDARRLRLKPKERDIVVTRRVCENKKDTSAKKSINNGG
jgi:hypothetical protein